MAALRRPAPALMLMRMRMRMRMFYHPPPHHPPPPLHLALCPQDNDFLDDYMLQNQAALAKRHAHFWSAIATPVVRLACPKSC